MIKRWVFGRIQSNRITRRPLFTCSNPLLYIGTHYSHRHIYTHTRACVISYTKRNYQVYTHSHLYRKSYLSVYRYYTLYAYYRYDYTELMIFNYIYINVRTFGEMVLCACACTLCENRFWRRGGRSLSPSLPRIYTTDKQ